MAKYMANNAAKNMSSLESHTIVPTLTMFGRVSEWILLLSMAEAAVTRLIIAPRSVQRAAGVEFRHQLRPGILGRDRIGLASGGAPRRNAPTRRLGRGY